jgi:HSP90 family molecular chaperone
VCCFRSSASGQSSLKSFKIFYVADVGKSIEELKTSVFVEKLDARGYEVLLLNQPVDEMLVQGLKQWKLVSTLYVVSTGDLVNIMQFQQKSYLSRCCEIRS